MPSNGEQEWYINSQYAPTARTTPWTDANNVLTITAAPTPAGLSGLVNNYSYVSGELNTYHSFAQTYGYFEIRAQLPAGQGFWPAFWLMPVNGQTLPELDVMEVVSKAPTVLVTTAHSSVTGVIGENTATPDTTAGFHTYGVDWEPDFITWYFDGQKVDQIATPADMNQPMYMIVNLAVGGIAGSPDGVSSGRMLVDYVRAFAPDSPGGSAATTYAPATDTVSTNGNYTLPGNVHNLTLTGAGQTVSGNSLDNVITSNDNNNILSGGAGADTLIAGRGHDTLTGGAGDDTFVYDGVPWNTGLITDFTPGQDQVDLRGMLASVGYAGSNPVGDGYLSLATDSAGATEVWLDPDGHGPAAAEWVFSLANTPASSLQVTGGFIVGAGDSPHAPTTPTSGAGQTFTSDNNGDVWIGTPGADTFNLGRGGDWVAGNGGADTFKFSEVPWTGGHITDFSPDDVLDLSALFARYGYAGANPISDGRLAFASDGKGGAQVRVDLDGLPHGTGGTWLVTTLDHVDPASLGVAKGLITEHLSGAFVSG